VPRFDQLRNEQTSDLPSGTKNDNLHVREKNKDPGFTQFPIPIIE
jgi:hypothetical protein